MKNVAYQAVKRFGADGRILGNIKGLVGKHQVQMYNPVLRTVNNFVRTFVYFSQEEWLESS